MNVVMMPTLHVGQGLHLGGLSVFTVWTDAPTVTGLDTGRTARVRVEEREGSPVVGDQLGADAGSGHALASRSPHHEIRGLGWDDHLLHATVFNRRHHLLEVA